MDLHKEGYTVVAMGDISGAIHNPRGLEVPALLGHIHIKQTGFVRGFTGAEPISGEDLLIIDC